MDRLWFDLVRLNSSIFVLEKTLSFRWDLFVIRRGHFWDLAEASLLEMCVLIIHRIAMDRNKRSLTLQRLKKEVLGNMQNPELVREFEAKLRHSAVEASIHKATRKIRNLRHKYIAHLDHSKNVAPTPADIKERALCLADVRACAFALNSFFDLLSFGQRRAMVPVDYFPPDQRPVSQDTVSDVDGLLDAIAQRSDLLNLPENDRRHWLSWRESLTPPDVQVLNQYRHKFGLPVR
jgi:hypothetical protein